MIIAMREVLNKNILMDRSITRLQAGVNPKSFKNLVLLLIKGYIVIPAKKKNIVCLKGRGVNS